MGFIDKSKRPHQLLIIEEEGDAPKVALEEWGVVGASWNSADRIIYAKEHVKTGGIYILDLNSGDHKQITGISEDNLIYRWPQWLPDEKHILVMRAAREDGPHEWDAVIFNTETRESTVVERDCTYARHVKSGYLF